MVAAYVLIQTEVGKSSSVASTISGLPGVKSAENVTGPYDVIVWLEASQLDDLGPLILSNIQTVAGITRTVTCTVVRA